MDIDSILNVWVYFFVHFPIAKENLKKSPIFSAIERD